MLYLEDYLELIEHLPQELRDRLTYIRESDLKVNNSSSQLEAKVKQFFAEAKDLTPEQTKCEYDEILRDYQKTMRNADDKVSTSTQTHQIMVKLVQRLDTELERFKLELEADHAGITEELERRSLELDMDTRLDVMLNNHLNNSSISTSSASSSSLQQHQHLNPLTHHQSNRGLFAIKDRRRSEHKQHRHHPYQNNHDNGYHGRAKLSHNHPELPTHNRSKHRQSNKYSHHQNSNQSRQHSTASSPTPYGANLSSLSAPPSVAGDLNSPDSGGHYGNNHASFNPGFRNSSNNKNNLQNNSPVGHQHSALSAALSSSSTPLNSVSALAMMNASSVHNKISNNNSGSLKANFMDLNSPFARQDPLAAAASQAIAATQQLQQGRRTPSLKASFAAINAAGMGGPLDSLGSNNNKQDSFGGTGAGGAANRNALAPMAPDQQAFRYNQYGKMSSNGNSSPLYISVTKSGRQTKKPRHHTSHLYPEESPTSISSDNSVFENSESLSSTDFIETGTNFGSVSPSSLDFNGVAQGGQGNTTLYHRDETKYCVCRQISYGEMVACDNEECEIEWFHYDCVGVTQPPKGKWYCPDCTRTMRPHNTTQQQGNQTQSLKKRGRKEKSLFSLMNSSLETIKSNGTVGKDETI